MNPSAPQPKTAWWHPFSYGGFGFVLGCVAVPIYIQVPFYYNRILEVPGTWIAALLLMTRLLDALVDPFIGSWMDKAKPNSTQKIASNRFQRPLLLAAPLLLLGMAGVFFPKLWWHWFAILIDITLPITPTHYAAGLLLSLVLVHLGYSLACIAHQAWGASLGQTDTERSRFVAAREGIGILGVIVCVALPLDPYASLVYMVFGISLILGLWLLLTRSPQPSLRGHFSPITETTTKHSFSQALLPLKKANFRALLWVFALNGLAAALPATLVPFYLRDRLGLNPEDQWVLAVYFLVGAAATILWVRLASHLGLAKAWALSMLLTLPCFAIVASLSTGDFYGYLLVCVLTGLTLGADLALPTALVAQIIHKNGDSGQLEGSYFGVWNWVYKLNLALSPALALGVLQWFNYEPSAHLQFQEQGLQWWASIWFDPLLWVYTLIPCALKFLAWMYLKRFATYWV